MTTFGDQLYQFGGVPVGMPGALTPGTGGKAFFVDYANGNDANPGSQVAPLRTLSKAHSLMTADRNDVAYVQGHNAAGTGAVRESAALAWSKNLCHIVGLNAYNRLAHRVSLRALSGQNFSPLVNVTASGCVFANFHAYHGYAVDEAQVCWLDAGERNSYFNVHFGGMGAALAGGHIGGRSLVISGGGAGRGERLFKHCTVGLDTVARSVANAELEVTTAATRDIFEDCLFLTYNTLGTGARVFVLGNAAANPIDRFLLFNRCLFVNSVDAGATAMTDAIVLHASVGGVVLLKDCSLIGATDWENPASGKVMIDGASPTANASGKAVDVAVA